MRLLELGCVLLLPAPGLCLDNGLALSPPMYDTPRLTVVRCLLHELLLPRIRSNVQMYS
jgi:hypothetical protein